MICSDSQSVISLASSDLEPPWDIAAIVGDIRFMAQRLSLLFWFIARARNYVAHWVSVPTSPVCSMLSKMGLV